METLPASFIYEGSLWPMNFPYKGPAMRNVDVFFVVSLKNQSSCWGIQFEPQCIPYISLLFVVFVLLWLYYEFTGIHMSCLPVLRGFITVTEATVIIRLPQCQWIDLIHKSQNAPVPYPTILNWVHLSLLNGALWDWNRCILRFVKLVYYTWMIWVEVTSTNTNIRHIEDLYLQSVYR